MQRSVIFRDFEERDIEFIYKCKTDKELNSLILNPKQSFSYEEATKWVHGCMGEHDTFKFWAICTNDDCKRIIGWMALSKIDFVNQSVYTHSIVIGDKDYRDGFAWIESVLFMLEYSFEVLKMNRVYGESLVGNKASNAVEGLLFMQREGLFRQAAFQNGRFYDISYAAILKDEYFAHKAAGDYEMNKLIRRLKQIRKQTK